MRKQIHCKMNFDVCKTKKWSKMNLLLLSAIVQIVYLNIKPYAVVVMTTVYIYLKK